MDTKLKQRTWYGFNHEEVNKKFSGNPVFISEFEIAGHTWAVYFCDASNRELGHKNYMMLGKHGDKLYASGRTKEEMEKLRYQSAILCQNCNTVLYSMNNHDYHGCGCPNNATVDGGREDLMYSSKDFSLVKILTLDLLTGTSFDPETGEIYTYSVSVD